MPGCKVGGLANHPATQTPTCTSIGRYEKARKLKSFIEDIRAEYTRNWDAKDTKERQVRGPRQCSGGGRVGGHGYHRRRAWPGGGLGQACLWDLPCRAQEPRPVGKAPPALSHARRWRRRCISSTSWPCVLGTKRTTMRQTPWVAARSRFGRGTSGALVTHDRRERAACRGHGAAPPPPPSLSQPRSGTRLCRWRMWSASPPCTSGLTFSVRPRRRCR